MYLVPDKIGPYLILGTLGRGGMGVVYRGRHEETGDLAAVKTVRMARESLLASFRREVRALAGLRSPGVVRILGDGVHEGLPWYAMELLDGVTLRRMLTPGPGGDGERTAVEIATVSDATQLAPMPTTSRDPAPAPSRAAALAVVRRLCTTLAFVHGEGIVHRDLKPSNVVVLPSGTPVLVDFGIVAHFAGTSSREALGLTADSLGTVAYIAPEQLLGELVDARADLYALGCILYEVLTGAPPFAGRSYVDTVTAHLEEEPIAPSDLADCPAGLDALVMRLLAKRPADRIGFASDVAAALGRAGVAGGDDTESPPPRAYLYRSRIAGRDDALERLRERLDRLSAGRGGLVAVGGESGAGKTRIAMECVRMAPVRAIRVLVGECQPSSGPDDPLHPLGRALQTVADVCLEQGVETTDRLLGQRGRVLALYEPALEGLPGQEAYPEPADLPPAIARLRLFRYLAATFTALAESAPLLLVLDDLQWADELTLGFLDFLLTRGTLEEARMLVVGTHRSEETGGALETLLATPGVERIELGRLETEAVSTMVGDMLALAAPPRSLSRFLDEQSEGNPFFVSEYLRAAVDEGLMWRDERGSWNVGAEASERELGRLGLPSSLRDLLERRLARLPAPALAAAEAAAVVGREVDHALLAHLLEIPEPELLAALTHLDRRGVLEDAGGALRFAHDKTREVAYSRIEEGRRRALHRSAARALEARDGALAAIGRHWEMAGERERARTAYLEAARRATARYAHAEAERLYRSRLALATSVSAEDVEARNELATLLFRTGRAPEAIAEHERAAEEARTLGERALEGRALRMLGTIYRETGRMDEARSALERAREIDRDAGREDEAAVLAELAILHAVQSRFDEAEALLGAVVDLARTAGDEALLARHLGNLAILHMTQGHLDRARALYEESLDLAHRSGDRRTEAINLGNLAILYGELGRLEEARATNERALAINREIGNRQFEGVVLEDLAYVEAAMANVERARALYDQAIEIHREVGNRRYEAGSLGYRSQLERRAGALDVAEDLAARGEALIAEVGDRTHGAIFACERGLVAIARGRDAREILGAVEEACTAVGATSESQLGRALARLRRACEAQATGGALVNGECPEDLPAAWRENYERS